MERTTDKRVFFVANIQRKNPETFWLPDFSMSKDYKKDVSAFGRWELNPHDSQKVGSDSESVVRALTAEQAC